MDASPYLHTVTSVAAVIRRESAADDQIQPLQNEIVFKLFPGYLKDAASIVPVTISFRHDALPLNIFLSLTKFLF